ncbi:NADH-quinone oxidoreductase subunit N [Pedobacter sp. SYSU D00535]|uniref:NADH-quinone oxidoreductase subunit N n=1 Tax=Pedobacter sp. SYSU D00535 TaxID=2810308 RepID=UPI001A9765DB|nr:NADH-quinone oxidoreductase subunit N [Pedobacter sp. SYSU D00535]
MNEYIPYLSELVYGAISGLPLFVPEIALVATFVIVILADLFLPGRKSSLTFWLCLAGIILSGILSFGQLSFLDQGVPLFHEHIVLDPLAVRFKLIFVAATLLFSLFIRSNRTLMEHKKGVGDLYLLLPAVLLGLNLMAMASSLLMIYVSVEMVSIASYLMVGYVSGANKQTEAAMKYALFGSVCSAVMLYGMSLLYGFTGTINITDESFLPGLSALPDSSVTLAVILTMVGIGFKLSFVPLHFWSPDVYEGAPTPVTAFLSTAPKVAGFAILIRFLGPFYSFASVSGRVVFDFDTILCVVAIITMIVGNFAAIWQNNIKRMLAYSSIGHTGFAMMALVAFSQAGFSSLIFYFAVYVIMNMAAFMLADRIETESGAETASAYKGLGRFFKLEMACFVIVLISLTGLPPTVGFVAKLLVFSSAFEQYAATKSVFFLLLLVTGAVTTVVSLFYYLKIPLNAYLRKAEGERELTVKPAFLTYVIALLSFLLVLLGVFPDVLA